jgi:hypothetical protein
MKQTLNFEPLPTGRQATPETFLIIRETQIFRTK